jgi:hypothetical protein
MTAPYKKRAKSGWNHDKKQSNKDERAFEKREINLITLEEEFDEVSTRAMKKAKKKVLKAKDIRNKIHSTERKLEFFKSEWCKSVINRYEQELKSLQEELDKMVSK